MEKTLTEAALRCLSRPPTRERDGMTHSQARDLLASFGWSKEEITAKRRALTA
jgi:hypothetical protein